MVSTKEYNFFNRDVTVMLYQYAKEMHSFANYFDLHQHGIVSSFTFGVTNLFNKKTGAINKTSKDVSNLCKVPEDIIFNQLKNFNRQIDDSAVIHLTSRKILTETAGISVHMEIVDLDASIRVKHA